MNSHVWRLAASFCPLLLVAACGTSGQHHTARLLDDRLQAQLAPDIAAGTAVLQPLPDGARVTLLTPSLFPNDVKSLAEQYPDIRAGVIEGLLDPSLMQIQVADTAQLPDDQRDTRVRNVNQYFVANGLGPSVQPAPPPQAVPPPPPGSAAVAPAGLTITISVQCPDPNDETGYRSGRSKPVCD